MAKKRPRRARKKRAFFRRRNNRPDLVIRPSALDQGFADYGQSASLADQIRSLIGQMHRKQSR